MSGFKADWRLVPRHEEEHFLSQEHRVREINEIPSHVKFPPLFEHFLMATKKKNNENTSETPMLPLVIGTSPDNRAILESELDSFDNS